jgi:uncharacterized protein YdhG (YjbR/CyaY superfamily)
MAGYKKRQFKTIDEYIDKFPKDIRDVLNKLRQTIQDAAPKAEETISYQIPTFKLRSINLVHFAAWKDHIGFYPTPSGIGAFKKELSSYDVSKGSVSFPLDKPLPLTLIRKIVKYRVKQELDNEKS